MTELGPLLDRGIELVLGILEHVVVGQASISLLDQLAVGGVEDGVIQLLVLDQLLGVGAVTLGELFREEAVASVDGANVASVGEVSINGGIFTGKLGLVEVPEMVHVGGTDTLVKDKGSVGSDEDSDGASTTGGTSGALGVGSNIGSNNESIATIPGRGLDPVDSVENRGGTSVTSVLGVNPLNIVVARLLEQGHENSLDRLGLVNDGLCTDLEESNILERNVVLLNQVLDDWFRKKEKNNTVRQIRRENKPLVIAWWYSRKSTFHFCRWLVLFIPNNGGPVLFVLTGHGDRVDILAIIADGHLGLSESNGVLSSRDAIKLLELSLVNKLDGRRKEAIRMG